MVRPGVFEHGGYGVIRSIHLLDPSTSYVGVDALALYLNHTESNRKAEEKSAVD